MSYRAFSRMSFLYVSKILTRQGKSVHNSQIADGMDRFLSLDPLQRRAFVALVLA
jgi:hypothetical protein